MLSEGSFVILEKVRHGTEIKQLICCFCTLVLLSAIISCSISSWGAKPLSIENEIVSSEMDGITDKLGVGGLKI